MRSLLHFIVVLIVVFASIGPSLSGYAQEDSDAPDAPALVDEQPSLPETEDVLPTATPVVAPTLQPTITSVAVPSRPEEVGAKAAASVVQIQTENGQGSGVAIADGILTAAHVVQDAANIHVTTADHQEASAVVARIDVGADLALLQSSLTPPTLDLEDLGSQTPGETLLVAGYTTQDDGSVTTTLTQGQFVSVTKGHNDRALVQTTARIVAGNSGGAIVNLRGKLVGVASFVVASVEQLRTYVAIGSDTVFAFLSLPATSVVPPPPSPRYHGDPRDVALQADFLGTGWVRDSEDTSKLKQGAYAASWHFNAPDGRVDLRNGVYVAAGAQALSSVFGLLVPADPTWVYITKPTVGDEVVAWMKPDATQVALNGRIKNVLVSVLESRGRPITNNEVYTPGGMVDMLGFMVNRVNSLAH